MSRSIYKLIKPTLSKLPDFLLNNKKSGNLELFSNLHKKKNS